MDELNNENINDTFNASDDVVVNKTPSENSMENTTSIPRPVNPRRKRKSKAQIFKEAYLPTIIAGVALLLILIFLIGSISRAIRKHFVERDASIAASESIEAVQQALNAEAERLLNTAAQQAAGYDYVSAIATIDSFSGDIAAYEQLMTKRAEYQEAQRNMVEYNNPNNVLNLSFHSLIADPARAFADEDFGSSYNANFVTITEFSNILQQLYNNGYMLVDMDDFITTTTGENGTVSYAAKTLYLPAGKKPLMITQTQPNYYAYMIDGDGDGLADKDGAGFASKLVVKDGKIVNEMVDAEGNTVYGAYDLVPILDAFIEAHPDFSFSGAKATLAVTGYEGLFGYRTDIDAKDAMEETAYNAELQGAATIINALRSAGYNFACYSYNNIGYGDSTTDELTDDLNSWTTEVVPLLGNVDTLVYAQGSDISDSSPYSGESYDLLKDAGFRYYLGFCDEGDPWTTVEAEYVRQGRILVTGDNMVYNSTWFTGIFDTSTVLDTTRPTE